LEFAKTGANRIHYSTEANDHVFGAGIATNMEWTILTPCRSSVWDRKTLVFVDGASKSDVPGADGLENV
jgi:hypothetical protein